MCTAAAAAAPRRVDLLEARDRWMDELIHLDHYCVNIGPSLVRNFFLQQMCLLWIAAASGGVLHPTLVRVERVTVCDSSP